MDMQSALRAVQPKLNINLKVLIKTNLKPTASATATHKGRHALRPYIAVVEYPLAMGGGIAWLKSQSAVNRYASQHCKVVYL